MFKAAETRRFVTRRGRALPFSLLGFGSAPLGNFPNPLTEASCDATVTRAWERGLRYYDTAPLYGLGLSENRVGRILARHRREDYLLSTKVGRVLEPLAPGETFDTGIYSEVPKLKYVYDYSYDGVMRSFEESLKRLRIDRVDMLYIHDPDHHHDQALQGAFKALDQLRADRVVDAIGVGMNQTAMLTRFAREAPFDMFLAAGRYTLLDQQALDELLPECEQRGISVVVGGVYNSGILANPTPGATFNYTTAPADVIEKAQRIQAVCNRYGVPLMAAAIQFPLRNPVVAAVLTGVRSVAEIEQNVAMFETPIPEGLWEELRAEALIPDEARVLAQAPA